MATQYTTALSNGDLTTLVEITCGTDHDFFASQDPAAYQQTFNSQKARNELVQFGEIRAVRVDGDQAVVELPAAPGNRPQEQELVTINLQKSGDDWKVCAPQ